MGTRFNVKFFHVFSKHTSNQPGKFHCTTFTSKISVVIFIILERV